ncbi:hypothetical protein HU200_031426 [Digitaria exilis]|uniref:KIB1-4 beta-propeller domain-containing protein n=1 Tax=Digitaria exilis TaxID=1010633 RepID=A0A835EPY1_9POAL|nr:hypothetical protein HU200_031426 [Digitaria exilis]
MAAQEENYSLPPSFGTRPWLVQATRGKTLTLIDPSDRSMHEIVIPEIEGKACLGCVHDGDWLMTLDESTCECSLAAAAGGSRRRRNKKVALPPLLHESLEFLAKCVVVHESPEHPHCTVTVSSSVEAEERFLLHCRPGDRAWTKLISPFKPIKFQTRIVSYKGKLHAFASKNNLIVLDVVNGKVQARLMGVVRDIDEKVSYGSAHYHFVESCGDLLLAFVVASFCRPRPYCLGRKGNLGVFDLGRSKDDPRSVWKILDKQEVIQREMELFDKDHEGREFCYLVELEGKLVSVFMRNAAVPPRVFKLDETNVS